jgi:amino acid adenylation domain-containing protein
MHDAEIKHSSTEIKNGFDLNRENISENSDDCYFQLSYAQERAWLLENINPLQAQQKHNLCIKLTGPLDQALLARACAHIIDRHDILRTHIVMRDTGPFQVISPAPDPFKIADTVLAPAHDTSLTNLYRDIQAIIDIPFDLAKTALLRIQLLRLHAEEHVLVIVLHHCIADRGSLDCLAEELAFCYAQALSGSTEAYPAPSLHYVDYAIWQRHWLESLSSAEKRAYWWNKLADAPTHSTLSSTSSFSPAGRVEQQPVRFHISSVQRDSLRDLATTYKTTLLSVVMTGFGLLLSRLSNQEDLVIGSRVSGRDQTELHGMIGPLENSLALRFDLSGDPLLSEALSHVHREITDGFANQDIAFEKLIEILQPDRDLSRHPIFQIMLVLEQDFPESHGDKPDTLCEKPPWRGAEIGSLRLHRLDLEQKADLHDITLILRENVHGLEGRLFWDPALFDETAIRNLSTLYERVLACLPASCDMRLSDIVIDGKATQSVRDGSIASARNACLKPAGNLLEFYQSLLTDGGLDSINYPDLFREQVARTPDAIACCEQGRGLSYLALDQKSNRLAWMLKARGVGTDDIVALYLPRSLDMISAQIGVLKAGAAFLPLEMAHPLERNCEILASAGINIIIAFTSDLDLLLHKASEHSDLTKLQGLAVPPIDQIENCEQPPPCVWHPRAMAYALFTSGSTGKPKGAMLENKGFMNHMLAKVVDFGLSERDAIAQTASVSFDISVWQCLAGLLAGAQINIVPTDVAQDPVLLVQHCFNHGISVLEVVPSLLRHMLAGLSPSENTIDIGQVGLRWMIATGEALPLDLAKAWLKQHPTIPIVNAYGPTECTDDVTQWIGRGQDGEGGDDVPIGYPLWNADVSVKTQWLGDIPSPGHGELWIGGACLGRGYIGHSGLTAGCFVPNPHADGKRIYRTGDRGWRDEHGFFHYLGRVDSQIKLRGVRIEPNEIEAALGFIAQKIDAGHWFGGAGVVLHDEKLVACIAGLGVSPSEHKLQAIHAMVGRFVLPAMIPSRIIGVDALPLSRNGKLDRKALQHMVKRELKKPSTVSSAAGSSAEPELSAVEAIIVETFKQTLNLDQVGREGNFFALGGHSLLAMQVVARLRERLGMHVELRTIFENATIGLLAAALEKGNTSSPSLPSLHGQQDRDVIHAQKDHSVARPGLP